MVEYHGTEGSFSGRGEDMAMVTFETGLHAPRSRQLEQRLAQHDLRVFVNDSGTVTIVGHDAAALRQKLRELEIDIVA